MVELISRSIALSRSIAGGDLEAVSRVYNVCAYKLDLCLLTA